MARKYPKFVQDLVMLNVVTHVATHGCVRDIDDKLSARAVTADLILRSRAAGNWIVRPKGRALLASHLKRLSKAAVRLL